MAQYPPGGFAPPPPGGFAPPPPMYSGGGPGGPPPNRPRTGLLIGVGCAGLVLLLVVGGAVGAIFMMRPSNASPTVATVTPGGAPVGSPGGTCAKTASCCQKIVQASGGDPAALKSCENFKQLPDANCTAALEGYKKSAVLLKVQCD